MNSIDDLVGLTIGVQQGNTSQPIPGVEVVCQGISVVNIAIAVPLADEGLLRHITAAAGALEQDGTLQRIRRKWLGNPYTDQSLATG